MSTVWPRPCPSISDPKVAHLNLNQALTAGKNEEGQIPPYHWVIVTNHVQVKHMAFTKEFNIETLTNVKLHSNGSVLLTTSNADGSNRISFLSEGMALSRLSLEKKLQFTAELKAQTIFHSWSKMLSLGILNSNQTFVTSIRSDYLFLDIMQLTVITQLIKTTLFEYETDVFHPGGTIWLYRSL